MCVIWGRWSCGAAWCSPSSPVSGTGALRVHRIMTQLGACDMFLTSITSLPVSDPIQKRRRNSLSGSPVSFPGIRKPRDSSGQPTACQSTLCPAALQLSCCNLYLLAMSEASADGGGHSKNSSSSPSSETAKILEIPVVVTEQYPKGLGHTVPELGADDIKKYSKTCFSMLTSEVEKELQSIPERRSVILCGIETQACIMSTTLDLLDKGYDVHVVADACSSRSQVDRLVALSRMKQSGAFLTTGEGVILQLLQDAAHPNFKEVQKIIKDPAPDSGLLALFQNQNPLFT